MITRCTNPHNDGFKKYGSRGIQVCDRWLNLFEDFYADMGEPPTPSHSIDRIDNDGNYEPGNCRWATATEQARNRRSSRILEHEGQSLTVAEWSDRLGWNPHVLYNRIKRRWPTDRIFEEPRASYPCYSGHALEELQR